MSRFRRDGTCPGPPKARVCADRATLRKRGPRHGGCSSLRAVVARRLPPRTAVAALRRGPYVAARGAARSCRSMAMVGSISRCALALLGAALAVAAPAGPARSDDPAGIVLAPHRAIYDL